MLICRDIQHLVYLISRRFHQKDSCDGSPRGENGAADDPLRRTYYRGQLLPNRSDKFAMAVNLNLVETTGASATIAINMLGLSLVLWR